MNKRKDNTIKESRFIMKKIILISIFILILDITTKQIVMNTLLEHHSYTIIKDFFSITYEKNEGVAFNLLEGNLPLIIISTIIIIFLILKYIKNNNINNLEKICYGLLIGGAIGNLIDRIIYGYVIDFLDFNIFGYNFPIFNLADTAIVIGIFILIILSIIESRNQNETNCSRKIKNR